MAIQIGGTSVIDDSRNVNAGITTTVQISAGSSTGILGQVLISTGTGIGWTTASSGGITELANVIGFNSAGIRSDTWNPSPSTNGRLEVFGQGNFQVFTSPGTYVVNPGISSIRVRVVGAGGRGGNGGPTATQTIPGPEGIPQLLVGTGGRGSGGGGGGYAHKVMTSFSAPRTYTVTVGASPGGTSSFGSEVSATGGNAGNTGVAGQVPSPPTRSKESVSGVTGGIGTGGDVNFVGASSTSIVISGPEFNINKGGAAASQKGTPSPIFSTSIPGLPIGSGNIMIKEQGGFDMEFIRFVDENGVVNRFPFDVFNGYEGYSNPGDEIGNATGARPGAFALAVKGYNGGSGGNHIKTLAASGSGGHGGGGGAGAHPGPAGNSPGSSGGIGAGGGAGGAAGSGGAGGSGLVIVEW